jgi:hypothetical protein
LFNGKHYAHYPYENPYGVRVPVRRTGLPGSLPIFSLGFPPLLWKGYRSLSLSVWLDKVRLEPLVFSSCEIPFVRPVQEKKKVQVPLRRMPSRMMQMQRNNTHAICVAPISLLVPPREVKTSEIRNNAHLAKAMRTFFFTASSLSLRM